jgi:hypothetical protein
MFSVRRLQMRVLSLIALSILMTTTARAEPGKDRGHRAAVTFSPLHLVLSIFEVQAEIYVTPDISVALIFGTGSIPADVINDPAITEPIGFTEYGAQVRYYFYGTTEEGAFVGGEFLQAEVDTHSQGISAVGTGFAVGPMVGYKWVWGGFALDLGFGASRIIVDAEAEGQVGDEMVKATESDSDTIPILNINIGWAF